jgi:hypothetical protein
MSKIFFERQGKVLLIMARPRDLSISRRVQIGSGAHAVFYSVGKVGFFLECKMARE